MRLGFVVAAVSPAVTTLLAIATGTIGAFFGNWFGAWRERQSLKWQARDQWLREIRGVLDDASRTISQTVYAFDRRRTAKPEERDQLGAQAYGQLMEAEVAGSRITTRLGDSDASRLWQEVVLALQDLSDHVFNLRDRELDELPDPDSERKQWEGERNKVAVRRDVFFAEAEKWLNAQELGLPGKPRLIRTSWRQRGAEKVTGPKQGGT